MESTRLRILVTGGTGFVGPYLIRFLKSLHPQIAVLVPHGSASQQSEVEYFESDICDADKVRKIVSEFRPHQIYHLAGISVVDSAWSNPRLTYEVNVTGAHNLFDAAMALPSPPRILNVSTSQVYGATLDALTESSLVGPDNPYAASKAMAELLTVQYRLCTSGGIITARSFNHSGAGQPPNFVLSAIAKQFAEIESGSRPPKLTLGNVAVSRDFTDVRDVVRAYCMLLNNGRAGEIYNVCSGTAVPLTEIIKLFQHIVGIDVAIDVDPQKTRMTDVSRIYGNFSKIKTEVGWEPEIPIQKTIQDLLDYWRSTCNAGGGDIFKPENQRSID